MFRTEQKVATPMRIEVIIRSVSSSLSLTRSFARKLATANCVYNVGKQMGWLRQH